MDDFLLDEDDDLVIKHGDFATGLCDDIDIDLILRTDTGNWKQWPFVGYGVMKDINAPLGPATVRQREKALRLQLEGDGFNVERAEIITGDDLQLEDIQIQATRDEPV